MAEPTGFYFHANRTSSTGGYTPFWTPEKSNREPEKFIREHGVLKINPEWKAYQERNHRPVTSATNPQVALPIVTDMVEYQSYTKVAAKGTFRSSGYSCESGFAESMVASREMMSMSEVVYQVGLNPKHAMDGLLAICKKYEIPMGLVNKLMALQEYDELEFLIDDSTSMKNKSDTTDDFGRLQTRWEEVHQRLKQMLELLAYVPTPAIRIHFLNRLDTITHQRKGEEPRRFLDSIYSQLDKIFQREPHGCTPIRTKLKESFQKSANRKVSLYLFCDGKPHETKVKNYEWEREEITKMLTTRANPKNHPVTLLSCTNEDDQVEWMKEAEEKAPYCAEYDDFDDEAREVMRDQGEALPFTRGFHLVGQLVAAMNPDDLDAMDECVPFTKWTLDNLLGVVSSLEDYNHYFNQFLKAQSKRECTTKLDRFKREYRWCDSRELFLKAKDVNSIPAVKAYKLAVESLG